MQQNVCHRRNTHCDGIEAGCRYAPGIACLSCTSFKITCVYELILFLVLFKNTSAMDSVPSGSLRRGVEQRRTTSRRRRALAELGPDWCRSDRGATAKVRGAHETFWQDASDAGTQRKLNSCSQPALPVGLSVQLSSPCPQLQAWMTAFWHPTANEGVGAGLQLQACWSPSFCQTAKHCTYARAPSRPRSRPRHLSRNQCQA